MTKPNSTPKEDALLEALFAEARADQPDATPDLLARVLADAEGHQPQGRASAIASGEAQAVPLIGRLLDAIGGWPSLAGLATATVAGLWIGLAAPESVYDLTGGYLGLSEDVDLIDLMPTADILTLEG